MQASVNIVGNVGNVRVFDNESSKTVYFSVAVNQRTEADKPIWYNFRAINGLAGAMAEYLEKGRLVAVVGVNPRLREYDVERTVKVKDVGTIKFKDKQTAVDYLATDVRFIGSTRRNGNGNSAEIEGELIDDKKPTDADELADNVPF